MFDKNSIKDFLKRHSMWIIVALVAILAYKMVTESRISAQADLLNIYAKMSAMYDSDSGAFTDPIRAEQLTQQAATLEELSTTVNQTVVSPLLDLFTGIMIIAIAIPLSGFVLFSYTKLPFVKMLSMGKDGVLDSYERSRLFGLVGLIFFSIVLALSIQFMR